MSRNRILWIDTVKAIAIFLIVLGHVLHGKCENLWVWIYSFHVPLFVVLSGFVFDNKNKKFSYFVTKKFCSLMVPYYIFSILSILVYQIMGGTDVSVLQCVLGMVWANGENGDFLYMKWNLPLWYIPMLFLMEMVSYWIFKYIKSILLTGLLFIFSILFAGALYYTDIITNLPFGGETVIYLFPFFVVGKFLDRTNLFSSTYLKRNSRLILGAFLLLFGSIITLFTQNVDYVVDEYRNYFVFVVIALFISCGTLLILSSKENGFSLCNYVGKHTMAILLMHTYPRIFLITYVPAVSILYERYTVITSVFVSILCMIMCLVVAIPFNRLMRLICKKNMIQI